MAIRIRDANFARVHFASHRHQLTTVKQCNAASFLQFLCVFTYVQIYTHYRPVMPVHLTRSYSDGSLGPGPYNFILSQNTPFPSTPGCKCHRFCRSRLRCPPPSYLFAYQLYEVCVAKKSGGNSKCNFANILSSRSGLQKRILCSRPLVVRHDLFFFCQYLGERTSFMLG